MPAVIIFPEDTCPDQAVTPEVFGCEGASRIEWIVAEKPAGSQVLISNDTIEAPGFEFSEDGSYTLTICCHFDEDGSAPNGVPTPRGLSCPLSVIAGQVAEVQVVNCEAANIELIGFTGGVTGSSFDNDGTGLITTDPNSPGPISITVRCTIFDEDFNPISADFTCTFEAIDPNDDLIESVGPPSDFEFVNCGQSCECTSITVIVDCDAKASDTAIIGIVFKECPPCEDPEECEEFEIQPLVGTSNAAYQECAETALFGCEELCCEPHRPLLFWNNLLNCPGWTAEAPAIEGSSIYNTASCNPGQKWCFEDSATIIFTGPPQFVDALVIWGHNMTDGTVTVSPLEQFGGSNTISTGVTNDGACMEGYTQPIIMNFADPEELPVGSPQVDDRIITELAVTITSNTGGPVCIDQIFIGQKFFLPDDTLPLNFQNPHTGSDYEIEFTEGSCGPLSRSLKHTPIEMSFSVECMDERYMKEKWRPFIRYAQRHGLMFQWSRNRCPQDIFNGWITGPIAPAVYNNAHYQTATMQARGYITQPQPVIIS